MSRPNNRQPWADFWSGSRTNSATCLPKALEQIDAAQSALWHGFAKSLAARSEVLDLGTGAGVVLKKMRQARTDLRLTGTDSSPVLPPPPKGIRLKPGVGMEDLPFASAHFDAVVSQFGYEYGDTKAAAPEVARVLKPGGRLLFMIHRRDGPIVAHNLPRRDALGWALMKSGYLDAAKALAAARRLAALPTPPSFRAAPQEAARLYPGQPVAGEFLQAVLQTLELSRGAPAEEALGVLAALEDKARNEIDRIDSLDRAACDADRFGILTEELRSAGLAIEAPGTLSERSGRPFAWLLSGVRISDPGTSR